MNTALTQKKLEEVFDQVTREVTQRAAGIRLYEGTEAPAGNLCTVYTEFNRGCYTGVSLCAEASLFIRLTQYMMQRSEVSPQDVEDFTKEYFNVLCGRIASDIFRATRIAPRFSPPSFCSGRYIPDGHDTHFILSYTTDAQENAQLIHHAPAKLLSA